MFARMTTEIVSFAVLLLTASGAPALSAEAPVREELGVHNPHARWSNSRGYFLADIFRSPSNNLGDDARKL